MLLTSSEIFRPYCSFQNSSILFQLDSSYSSHYPFSPHLLAPLFASWTAACNDVINAPSVARRRQATRLTDHDLTAAGCKPTKSTGSRHSRPITPASSCSINSGRMMGGMVVCTAAACAYRRQCCCSYLVKSSSTHHPPSSTHHPPIIHPSSTHHPPIIHPSSTHHPPIIHPWPMAGPWPNSFLLVPQT